MSQGIDLVGSYAHLSEQERALPFAAQLGRLYATYYADVTFSRKQAKAREAAADNGHRLETLQEIERYVSKVKGARERWDFRVELCETPTANVAAVAARRLKQLVAPREPQPGVRVYRRTDKIWTLTLTGNSVEVGKIFDSVDQAKPVESFTSNFFEGAQSAPAFNTHVILRVDELNKVVDGDGDDVTLHLNTGATMTGKQFVEQALAEQGYITVVDPAGEPVNLYRLSRVANSTQRKMLSALYPTCVWPDCNHPSRDAQMHHIVAWEDGGMTNIDNLVPLCPYHNGVNEDGVLDPKARGRIARINGRVAWLPPWSGLPVYIEALQAS